MMDLRAMNVSFSLLFHNVIEQKENSYYKKLQLDHRNNRQKKIIQERKEDLSHVADRRYNLLNKFSTRGTVILLSFLFFGLSDLDISLL